MKEKILEKLEKEINACLEGFVSVNYCIKGIDIALDEYADWKIKELTYFLEHSKQCILGQFEAGEPTEDGGYRQKYAGKWYQVRPIDKTPKCDCGLDQILLNKDKK